MADPRIPTYVSSPAPLALASIKNYGAPPVGLICRSRHHERLPDNAIAVRCAFVKAYAAPPLLPKPLPPPPPLLNGRRVRQFSNPLAKTLSRMSLAMPNLVSLPVLAPAIIKPLPMAIAPLRTTVLDADDSKLP